MYGASGGIARPSSFAYFETAFGRGIGYPPSRQNEHEFWDQLQSRFVRDASALHRQNWRMVKLRISGSQIILQDWEKFHALYVSRRALVEDWTDADDT